MSSAFLSRMFRLFTRPTAYVALALFVGVVSGCQKALPPKEAARVFFEQLIAGKTHEAYESTAFGFQTQQSELSFDTVVREMGFSQAVAVEIEEPEIDGRTAKLEAAARSAEGAKLKFNVTMQKEKGAWRIFSLRRPRSLKTGLSENRFSIIGKTTDFTPPADQPVPSDAELEQLATETIQKMAEALKTGSFSDFYDYVSKAWQLSSSRQQLQEQFQGKINEKLDLTSVSSMEPQFIDPPMVNSDGLLVINGSYPTTPKTVFSAVYVYEYPEWKLCGINISNEKSK